MKLIILMIALITPVAYAANSVESNRTDRVASHFCDTKKECVDIISMELESMYYKGHNERDKVSIGTLINRKTREYAGYCTHHVDKELCENYKNQLLLKYISGLLNR